MEYDKVIITTEDGLKFECFKENDKLKIVKCNGRGSPRKYEVKEDSVQCVKRKPLIFTYYDESGSKEAETVTPVKEIEYKNI